MSFVLTIKIEAESAEACVAALPAQAEVIRETFTIQSYGKGNVDGTKMVFFILKED